MMTDRRIAILVDGSFFLRRLSKLIPENRCDTPIRIVACLRRLCRTHVANLTGIESDDKRWHRHIYRSFYYDARPYDGKAHHPLTNRAIDFAKSNLAREREALFHQLRRHPKLALRLGKVSREDDWTIHPKLTKRILKSIELIAPLEALGSAPRDQAIPASEALTLTADEAQKLRQLRDIWKGIEAGAVALNLRQKGVDMRIGLDISTLALKKQVDTIVLVAGDSDFVPAAKLARREGIQFILDPLWQQVNDDLHEHIDGLSSGLPKSAAPAGAEATIIRPPAAVPRREPIPEF